MKCLQYFHFLDFETVDQDSPWNSLVYFFVQFCHALREQNIMKTSSCQTQRHMKPSMEKTNYCLITQHLPFLRRWKYDNMPRTCFKIREYQEYHLSNDHSQKDYFKVSVLWFVWLEWNQRESYQWVRKTELTRKHLKKTAVSRNT